VTGPGDVVVGDGRFRGAGDLDPGIVVRVDAAVADRDGLRVPERDADAVVRDVTPLDRRAGGVRNADAGLPVGQTEVPHDHVREGAGARDQDAAAAGSPRPVDGAVAAVE